MRIRPDAVELLQTARIVVGTTIGAHVPADRHRTLRAVERAMVRAEDRIARDVPASAAEIAALAAARAAMRGEILDALPPERRYDARLVARAIAIAAQQLASRYAHERREYERLTELLNVRAQQNASRQEIRRTLPRLNRQLVSLIRAGAADVGTGNEGAIRAYLEAITDDAHTASNPTRNGVTAAPSARHAAAAMAPSTAAPPIATGGAPFARVDGWLRMFGTVSGVMYGPAAVGFAAQAKFLGWFAQRLAANPYVPMAAVEGAHQAHDLSVGLADASAAFCTLALAPLRGLEARTAAATPGPQ